MLQITNRKSLAWLKGVFAKGCFFGFAVLRRKAPFALSRVLGGFAMSPIQEALSQTPRWRKMLKAPSGKSTL